MAAGGLQLEVREHERAVVVAARGEVDVACVQSFADALERAIRSQRPQVVVDLSGLQFIDSSGLAALIKADEEAKASGKELTVVRGPRQVQQLLELTGFSERLVVVDSLEQLQLSADN
jgi:anti-sigma B factor antagonist